jgi:hypothetical protein
MANLRSAIDAHCRNCIHDPEAPGTWRQQVAACASANCALFRARPVPRNCASHGVIRRDGVTAVCAKLEPRQAERRPA